MILHLILAFWIGLGGFFGALLRMGIGSVFPNFFLGTFCSNILGCFLLGVTDSFITESVWLRSYYTAESINVARLAIVGGFIGALTTFSTLVFESSQLIAKNQIVAMLMYVLLSLFCGYFAFIGGGRLGRLL